MTTAESPQPSAPAAAPVSTPLRPFGPRIAANRRTLDNQFPALAFTIFTAGRPYYEVLLTTDASLFAAANAVRRNAGNYYASRQDGGLLRAAGSDAVYLVPTAVLRGFAQAQPHPSAIYYTLIGFEDSSGGGPAYAYPPDLLPTFAPSVAVSRDYQAHTLATVLAVPAENLRRHCAAEPRSLSEESDLARGEDGCGIGSGGLSVRSLGVSALHGAPQGLDTDPVTGPQDGYELEHAPAVPAMAQPARQTSLSVAYSSAEADDYPEEPDDTFDPYAASRSAATRGLSGTAGLTYNDGYGDLPGEEDSYAVAQSRRYPIDAVEPAALPTDDADYDGYGDDDLQDIGEPVNSGHNAGYGGGYSLATDRGRPAATSRSNAYGDEADGWEDEEPPAFRALDDPASAPSAPAVRPLSIDAKLKTLEKIAPFESGAGLYSAINTDSEFGNPNHPAYQKYHIGLSYGIIQFTQDSGMLGALLTMMRKRDGEAFDRIFGSQADDLIRLTTSPGPISKETESGRSVRVQPLGGADLWEEPWRARFVEAGKHIPFQAAQNELAASAYIDPMLPFAKWLCLDTDRALAIVVDRAIQMGPGGARKWIVDAVDPVQTMSQRQQALAALGYADVKAFQEATAGLDHDSKWGPMTNAALIYALHGLGSASPIPIPTRDQMLDALDRQSAGTGFAHRVHSLRTDSSFDDLPYQL